MLLSTGTDVLFCLYSSAHCCLAPSIWRRLLMQAFCCAVVRACTKLGIAIAAKRPIMATTIMISIKVKPCLRDCVFFITRYMLSFSCGLNNATGGLILLFLTV